VKPYSCSVCPRPPTLTERSGIAVPLEAVPTNHRLWAHWTVSGIAGERTQGADGSAALRMEPTVWQRSRALSDCKKQDTTHNTDQRTVDVEEISANEHNMVMACSVYLVIEKNDLISICWTIIVGAMIKLQFVPYSSSVLISCFSLTMLRLSGTVCLKNFAILYIRRHLPIWHTQHTSPSRSLRISVSLKT